MISLVNIRKRIIATLLVNPVLGQNYVDWNNDNGECGVTIMLPDQSIDIIIREHVKE